MKIAHLFHNPGAGAEEFDRDEIISLVERGGFECRYSSTKEKGWKDFDEDTEFVVMAGGDGTVRKVAETLLARQQYDKMFPLGLLPLGTANNIAKTLKLDIALPEIIKAWHNRKVKQFDIGLINHPEVEQRFFLESLGFGLFPFLMMEMKKRKKDEEQNPSLKLQSALDLLQELIESYEPRNCTLIIDGADHSGRYILAEIMNTQSIGPNLALAPDSDPGDGLFDVVVVPEADKRTFLNYVSELANDTHPRYEFRRVQGKQISITWNGTHVHVDDQIVKIEKDTTLSVNMSAGLLKFLVL